MKPFNAQAERARLLEESHVRELEGLGQSTMHPAGLPSYPTDTMGQGTLGGFQGGNLGTFMNQSPAGGNVGSKRRGKE